MAAFKFDQLSNIQLTRLLHCFEKWNHVARPFLATEITKPIFFCTKVIDYFVKKEAELLQVSVNCTELFLRVQSVFF